MVPSYTYDPFLGFAIFLVWMFGIFFSLYSIYLYLWYLQGEANHLANIKLLDALDLEHNRPLWKKESLFLRDFSNARAESFTYATTLVGLVVWFVLVRLHTYSVSFWEVAPPMMALGVSVILGLTFVFYRLPLLWYQEGLSGQSKGIPIY
jgi:hypothetical protein